MGGRGEKTRVQIRACRVGAVALGLALLGSVHACRDSSLGGPDAAVAAAADSVPQDALCAADLQSAQSRAVEDRVHAEVACFSGDILSPGSAPKARYVFDRPVGSLSFARIKPCVLSQAGDQDGGGIGTGAEPLDDPAFAAKATTWEEEALRSIADLDTSCLTTMPAYGDPRFVFPVIVEVASAAGAPNERLHEAGEDCCPHPVEPETGMTIGADGSVAGTFGFRPDESACVLKALEGLTFPCLAGTSICYDWQVVLP
jgi:hypothetical protein